MKRQLAEYVLRKLKEVGAASWGQIMMDDEIYVKYMGDDEEFIERVIAADIEQRKRVGICSLSNQS